MFLDYCFFLHPKFEQINTMTMTRARQRKLPCSHPVNPVFAVRVSDAAVEGVGRQYEDEVSSVAHAAQKVVVELAGTEFLDVEEDRQTAQLQVNFQQTAISILNQTSKNSVSKQICLCKYHSFVFRPDIVYNATDLVLVR